MSYFINNTHLRLAAALMLAIIVSPWMATSAEAAHVPPGTYTYDSNYSDINAPPMIVGIAGFDGTNFFTPGPGIPIDTLEVAIGNGETEDYPDVVFSIDSGFQEVGTTVIDANGSGTINDGDDVSTVIGPGTFSFKQYGVLLIGGNFDNATFSATIGGSSGTVFASDPKGLDLFPGPAFKFDGGTFVENILDQEGFGFNLTSIPQGSVSVALPGTKVFDGPPAFFISDLLPFGVSNGSVNTSGTIKVGVIPEPSTITLGLVGLLGLAGYSLRRRREK